MGSHNDRTVVLTEDEVEIIKQVITSVKMTGNMAEMAVMISKMGNILHKLEEADERPD